MIKLLRFLKPYTIWVVLAPAAMVVEVLMDLLQPSMMGRIIDRGVTQTNTSEILSAGAIMMVFAFAGLAGGICCTYFSSRASLGMGLDLRRALFDKVVSMSFAETDKFTAGSLITRMVNDVRVMQMVVTMITRKLVRAPLMLAGSVVIVLSCDPHIAVPLLAAAPVLTLLVLKCVFKMRRYFGEMQKRIDDVNTIMGENLSGIRVVKSYNMQDSECKRFSIANAGLAETGIATGRIMIFLGPSLAFVQHMASIGILLIAARDVNERLIKIGEVVAVTQYATQVMMSLVMISFDIMHLSRAQVAAERITDILSSENPIKSGDVDEPACDGSVCFESVGFSYPGASGEPVLSDISFSLKPGGTYAFIGATGSGKSTLVSLIPRFYDATAGRITIGGRDIREYTLRALRSAIGTVMQNPKLLSGTIASNIRVGKEDAAEDEVRQAAEESCASGFIESLPDGYDTPVAQDGTTLSGGQRQRIAIARSIISRPEILILDDATSALDSITEKAVLRAVRAGNPKATIIIVAQRISTVKNADCIFVMEQGRICARGTHNALSESCSAYREILDSQTQNGDAA